VVNIAKIRPGLLMIYAAIPGTIKAQALNKIVDIFA